MSEEPVETAGGLPERRRARALAGVRQVRKPGSPRSVRHVVKVTEEQEQRLLARALERNITVPRLMVESALAGGAEAARAKSELAGELFRMTRAVSKIGVNINQLARATNATFEEQPETAAAFAAHGRVMARLEQLLEDLDRPVPPRAEDGPR